MSVYTCTHGEMRWARWWWTVVVVWAVVCSARELDPGACAARFDLQRDKIIRTEESREMGARYLSELDVGARQECLRLCCETDGCDVFVYEERAPGSCYLFECGPPEDFRCKFTAHSNFSSGVLALSRRLAELQDQEARAHHERALAGLRAAPAPAPAPATSTATTTATASSGTTTTTTTPPPPPPPPPAPTSASRCSRYQFECRRGGECIAVYNACDGVAQCADGSDEAPELGCPPAGLPGAPPPPQLPAGAPPSPAAPPPPERWPHRLAQAQPPAPASHRDRYNEMGGAPPPGSHIFSHKGGLLQEPEPAAPPQYPPFEPPWPRRLWPQQPNGMETVGGWGYPWGGGAGEPRAWPVGTNTMPEVPVVYSSQQHTLRDGPKKGLEVGALPPPTPAPPPDRREEVPLHTTAHTKPHKDKSEPKAGAGAGVMERHLAGDEHDGLSEHPPAAVLLLVIGVMMTGCMAAMVGCRARATRRRLRRGKPLAHDADYLVNGMYL